MRSLPAVNPILEAVLLGKARVACAVMNVWDVGVELFIFADLQTVERVLVGICGEFLALKEGRLFANGKHVLFGVIEHGFEVVVILGGECLGSQNDLMFAIDQGLCVVALDDAVGGGHLDRLVVYGVALDLLAVTAKFGFAIL